MDDVPGIGFELFDGFFITPLDLHRWVSHAMEWAVMLFPVMVYFVYMGLGVNWRSRPTVMRGPKNAVAFWLALSGFLLVGPLSWGPHFFKSLGPAWYWGAYAAYVGLLIVAIAFAVSRQRSVLIVYAIEPAVFAEVLREVLAEQVVPHSATPSQVSFGDGEAVLNIESFALLGNVRLQWQGGVERRAPIEAALRAKLREVSAGANLSAALFSIAAGLILIYIYVAVAFFAALNGWLDSY